MITIGRVEQKLHWLRQLYVEKIKTLISLCWLSYVVSVEQVTARALPHLEEDERLLPMLVGLSKRYLGSDYSVKKNNVGQVTADMIDMVCFPCLCNIKNETQCEKLVFRVSDQVRHKPACTATEAGQNLEILDLRR